MARGYGRTPVGNHGNADKADRPSLWPATALTSAAMTRTAHTATVDGQARPELAAWLDATCEFVRAVNHGVPFDDLLNLIAGTVAQLTTFDYCSVLLPDAASEKLLIRGFYGLRPSYVAEVNAARAPLIRPGDLAEGPSSRAFRTQRPVVLPDIRADVTCLEWELVAAEQGYRSILSLPLVASEGSLGVLTCYTRQRREFAPGEVVLMEAIANQAALAIESGRLREREQARVAALEERVAVWRRSTASPGGRRTSTATSCGGCWPARVWRASPGRWPTPSAAT